MQSIDRIVAAGRTLGSDIVLIGAYELTLPPPGTAGRPCPSIRIHRTDETFEHLAPAVLGTPYSVAMTASGGTPEYSFSASGLPAGVSFVDGALTGTPTTEGTATITVTVTDSVGCPSSREFFFSAYPPAMTSIDRITATLDGAGDALGSGAPQRAVDAVLRAREQKYDLVSVFGEYCGYWLANYYRNLYTIDEQIHRRRMDSDARLKRMAEGFIGLKEFLDSSGCLRGVAEADIKALETSLATAYSQSDLIGPRTPKDEAAAIRRRIEDAMDEGERIKFRLICFTGGFPDWQGVEFCEWYELLESVDLAIHDVQFHVTRRDPDWREAAERSLDDARQAAQALRRRLSESTAGA